MTNRDTKGRFSKTDAYGFKIGDRVKGRHWCDGTGMEGVIEDIDGDGDYIIKGAPFGHQIMAAGTASLADLPTSDASPSAEAAPFKVGDRVELLTQGSGSCPVGTIGKVFEVHANNNIEVDWPSRGGTWGTYSPDRLRKVEDTSAKEDIPAPIKVQRDRYRAIEIMGSIQQEGGVSFSDAIDAVLARK
jgi:hypothetical protein